MEVNPEGVPATLRERSQWILWRNEERNGEPTKVPYQANGQFAKSTDPATWTTFEVVVERFKASGGKYSGIGFVFAEGGGICGIDLDGCRNPRTGEWADWARSIIKDFETYTELSPSETGAKMFVVGKSPLTSGRNKRIDAARVSGKEPGIEVYDRGRYFAVTGNRLAKCPAEPQERQSQLERYCGQWFAEKTTLDTTIILETDSVVERARRYVSKMPSAVSGQGGHNATFSVACVLKLGFCLTDDEAFALLSEWNAGCQPPWSAKDLQHKIQSAGKQDGPRGWLKDVPQARWASVKLPTFKPAAEPPKSATLQSAAEEYLADLVSGTRKLITLGIGDLDYAIGGGVAESEMVIMAARPGHGKTCVGLQSAYGAASQGNPVLVISEEMSRIALGKRVLQYATGSSEEDWKSQPGMIAEDIEKHFFDMAPIYVVESCGTMERAAAAIRQHVEEHGVKLVLVDYGQLLQSRGANKYEQTSATSVALRQITNELKITSIVLAQLNRAVDGRDKAIPRMGDLRDSGQLEQDADVIIFLSWPHRIDSTRPEHEYQMFIAKNRSRAILAPAIQCRFYPNRQMLRAEEGTIINGVKIPEDF